MKTVRRLANPFTVAAVMILVGILFWSTPAEISPIYAQSQADTAAANQFGRTITVVGEGQVNIKPDMAQTTVGVESVEANLQEANAATNTAINNIIKALKENGLIDVDLQTTGFSIWLERPYIDGAPSDNTLYHVSNQVNVTIKEISKVSDILDAAIQAGANSMYGITFSLQDPSKVESTARTEAMKDARAKAKELAELSGVKLGDIVRVSEGIGGNAYYNSFQAPTQGGLGGGGGTPVSPGELKMTMQLEIVFNIE